MFEVGISEDNVPVKWMFKNMELKPSEHYMMLSEKRNHKLIIQNVDNSKEGEYTAVVGHLQCSAHLVVECKSKPLAFYKHNNFAAKFKFSDKNVTFLVALRVTRPLNNVEVPETLMASFECEVSHFNVLSTWLKNGVGIEMSEKFRMVVQGKQHQLKVMNSSKEDSGEYSFVCGSDRVSAVLTVNRKTLVIKLTLIDL